MSKRRVREIIDPFKGILIARRVPFATEEEFKRWWVPERDASGRIIREPRLSLKERERYEIVAESENTLTVGGRSQLLAMMATTAGNTPTLFGAYFAIGSGSTPDVFATDTSLNTEYFRKTTSGYVINGNQVDVSAFLGASEGNGTISNVGFYGGASATATIGTGTLCTHSRFTYTKVNGVPVTIDYVIIQQGS